jgi:DNA-binding transcriptional LysR family regulator
MDLISLRTFAMVAEHGGVTGASRSMHTVQSNITQRIRALEAELGLELFSRHHRGMVLTRAGQRMLPYVNRISALVSEAKSAAAGQGAATALAIGSMETTAAVRLPRILAAYRQRQPGVAVSLDTGPTARLVDAVLERRLDGAFIAGPLKHDALASRVAFEEELVLVSSPAIKRTEDIGKHLAEGGAAIMFKLGCSYRQRFEQILGERGWPHFARLEMGTLEGILGCVGAGMGISLLPRSVVRAASNASSLKCHAVPQSDGTKYRVQTLFIRLRQEPVSASLSQFMRLL